MANSKKKRAGSLETSMPGIIVTEFGRRVSAALRLYSTSTDERLQRLGNQFEEEADALRGRLPEMKLQNAISQADEFLGRISASAIDEAAYTRTKAAFERAGVRLVEAASRVGVRVSLPPVSYAEIEPPRTPSTRKKPKYPLTPQQIEAIGPSAIEAYDALAAGPGYQDGVGVSIQELGRAVAGNIFGDDAAGNRHSVVAMIISHNPGKYGFDKIKGPDGRTYVSRR